MKKLTEEEIKSHDKTIKSFRKRIQNIKFKYADGDITRKRMELDIREIKDAEFKYIKDSGIILFYGQLFKVVA